MKQKITAVLFAFLLVVGGVAFTAPEAEAACSYNGLYNSQGKCARSYGLTYNRYNNTAELEAYIQQLLQIIERLREIRDGQHGSGGYGLSDVDVTTHSAREIEDHRATLRGTVDFNNEDEATVYFIYGRSNSNLSEETVNVVLDDSDDEDFSQRITGLRSGTTYYFRAVAEDEEGDRAFGALMSFRTDGSGGSSSSDNEPDVDTDEADNVGDHSAELNGSVDMNDFNNGRVFFVYGEDENQVEDIEDDYDTYSEIEEDGDDLQKVLLDSDLDDNADYDYTVGSLDSDTDIFYTICVEYENEDDDDVITCGNIEEFTTGDNGSSNNDEPDVDTENEDDVTDDSAELNGFVDMNDFNNGRVFFVYGEDENQVEDIEHDYDEYADIDEDGDDLQKITVDSDLDSSGSYSQDVDNLDSDTDIFYQICVEFDDEDDDPKIICGGVVEFTTDN